LIGRCARRKLRPVTPAFVLRSSSIGWACAKVGWAVLLALVVSSGCASRTSESRNEGTDGGPNVEAGVSSDGYAPEERHIALTLQPFYDTDDVLASSEDALPTPIGGVEVCVKSHRPHLGDWADFVELDLEARPCETSTDTDDPITLEGVPPDSELLVTATKDGYWPGVVAAVTGQWATNATKFFPPTTLNRLVRRDSSWPGIGPEMNEGSASIAIGVVALTGAVGALLGGARISLAPGPSSGPFYGDGMTFDPEANATIPSALASAGITGPATNPGGSGPVTLFQDVAPGEHVLRFEHALAHCRAWGSYGEHAVFGYPGHVLDELRVPALAGHVSAPVLAHCTCVEQDAGNFDLTTCEPVQRPDAGVP
jgi:hypothetical protein